MGCRQVSVCRFRSLRLSNGSFLMLLSCDRGSLLLGFGGWELNGLFWYKGITAVSSQSNQWTYEAQFHPGHGTIHFFPVLNHAFRKKH